MSSMPQNSNKKSNYAAVVGLFFLAPLVGEFLLGNLPITWLWTLMVLAPMYGGGALLIRESARRWRLGWPGIVLFGLAYAVIEEAFVTQSLFNPNYLGYRLLDYGFMPNLGISSWWTVFVLSIHTIWSTAVPIALTEALANTPRRRPWLGKTGLVVVALVFLLGCAASSMAPGGEPFTATVGQFMASGLAVAILIFSAFWFGRLDRPGRQHANASRSCPDEAKTGAAAFLIGSAFMSLAVIHNHIPAFLNVIGMLAAIALGSCLLMRWSRSKNWTSQNELGAAVGLLLVYAWYGFVQMPSVGGLTWQVDAFGNAVFAAAAIALSIKAYRVERNRSRSDKPAVPESENQI